jgi:DNA-binding transcriptional regulator LsrR (DeoR family)
LSKPGYGSLEEGAGSSVEDLRGLVREGTWTDGTFPTGPSRTQLAAEYAAGATARGLAQKYGLHRRAVVLRLRGAGVKTGQRTMAADEELVSSVHALRDAGLSARKISREIGISHQSVTRLLTANR